MVNQLINR